MQTVADDTFAHQVQAEWSRLVRYCTAMVHDVSSAEDLAQEAINAAWRSTRRPERGDEIPPWLTGIARHQCLSWLRRRHRSWSQRLDVLVQELDHQQTATNEDPESVMEHTELVQLLDRALALLPLATRSLLIAKYIDDASLAEIAARWQLSESAAAARLQRGKAALRQVLITHFADETTDWHVLSDEDASWRDTRIWCPDCGQRQLQVRREAATGIFAMRCAQCMAQTGMPLTQWNCTNLLQGLQSPRAVLSRISAWGDSYFRAGRHQGSARCLRCGRLAPLVVETQCFGLAGHEEICVMVHCEHCRLRALSSLDALALAHPRAQQFWRDEGRIMTLPPQHISLDGRAVHLASFRSLHTSRQLDIVTDSSTLDVIQLTLH